ncbi:hypothetical protein ASF23_15375 [Curtobacterium sp. Leaf261]|nr:hypothetical protein ASF23_15375 [Curtobacterium sp. Leaf261]
MTDAERQLWHAWKTASERVREHVAEDIRAATGLSDPDFGILTRLVDLGGGVLRQNELGASMGWHRSRLSHQLTRMEGRGLVARATVDGGVEVAITTSGRALVATARPVHASSVREHLLAHIAGRDAESLRRLLDGLADGSTPSGH